MTFKEYYTIEHTYRKAATEWMLKRNYRADEIREHLYFLDKAQIKAEKDEGFRIRFTNWTKNGSTLELREIASELGYNGKTNFIHFNIIDFYDTLNANLN